MILANRAPGDLIQLTVPAKIEFLISIRQLIADVARSTLLNEEEMQDFNLAVMEAATNAIRHSGSQNLTIIFKIDSDSVTARILDQGRGYKFHAGRCQFPSLMEESGRGIPLMDSLVDTFKVQSKPGHGTEVTLIKKFGRVDQKPDKAWAEGISS